MTKEFFKKYYAGTLGIFSQVDIKEKQEPKQITKNQNIKYEKFVDKNGNEHIRKVNRGKR